eukprot:1140087-Amphidinium_carterae.2
MSSLPQQWVWTGRLHPVCVFPPAETRSADPFGVRSCVARNVSFKLFKVVRRFQVEVPLF